MEELLASDNHLVLSRIFLGLDGRSLKAARLVCRAWNEFIRDQVWGCTLYRDVLKKKLDASWRDAVPSASSVQCGGAVFHVDADRREAAVSLETGVIEVWDREAGERRMAIDTGCKHGLRVALTPSLIVGAFFQQNVRVWHRLTGELLQLHPLESSVHGLALVGDLVLVSMVSGDVAVFACAAAAAGGKLEEVRTISAGVPRGPNHMSACGQWLLYAGNKRDLVLHDLRRGREVRRLANRTRIWSVHMVYPVAVTSGMQRPRPGQPDDAGEEQDWEAGERGQEDRGSGGILVWDLVEGRAVRRLRLRGVESLALNSRRLVVLRRRDVLMLEQPLNGGGPLVRITRPDPGGGGAPAAAPTGGIACNVVLEDDKLVLPGSRCGEVVTLDFWMGLEKAKKEALPSRHPSPGLRRRPGLVVAAGSGVFLSAVAAVAWSWLWSRTPVD